jgi:hypothetical protein
MGDHLINNRPWRSRGPSRGPIHVAAGTALPAGSTVCWRAWGTSATPADPTRRT